MTQEVKEKTKKILRDKKAKKGIKNSPGSSKKKLTWTRYERFEELQNNLSENSEGNTKT